MIWLVFRNKWFAVAWVVMICASIAFRFALSQMIWGGDPASALAQAAAFGPDESATSHAGETANDQENKARRELEQKRDRSTVEDAQGPTVNVDEHN